uniref:Achatin-1 n=1 Tax=Lissachatina fulica TaxID=2315439 RepID=ACH1_LISFU
GFAD